MFHHAADVTQSHMAGKLMKPGHETVAANDGEEESLSGLIRNLEFMVAHLLTDLNPERAQLARELDAILREIRRNLGSANVGRPTADALRGAHGAGTGSAR